MSRIFQFLFQFMRKYLCLFMLCSCVLLKAEHKSSVDSLSVRSDAQKGWTFGVLPCVAYDADAGFQYGALANIYYYGDGSTYPNYLHSFYVEASYTTMHYGVFRLFYDSDYLIPEHRFIFDISYVPNAMSDFLGFNGYTSRMNADWIDPATDAYKSKVFYKYQNNLFRTAADIEGTISGHWKWNAGLGVLGYMTDAVNVNMLNKARKEGNKLPNVPTLYQHYVDWGIISANEAHGGWHPYLRGGITYDSRDYRTFPTKGIYADAFLTYSAAFGAQAPYNHLKANFNFRHFVSLYRDYAVFAYRVGAQSLLAGRSPFYMDSYFNTLFLQRELYEALGGGNSLRGIMCNRILSKGFAYANIEFRFKLVKFDIAKQHFYIGLNPFLDGGMVIRPAYLDEQALQQVFAENENESLDDYFDFSSSQLYMPHLSAGIGLKIAMNENFVLSGEWAAPFNKQDAPNLDSFYVKFGYLF